MRWQVTHGDYAERRRETYAKAGAPIPDHLFPPDILPGLQDWIEAFWELHTDRQIGMAAGPIPAASIDRWIAMGRVGPDEEWLFRKCIRAMDGEWRKAADEKAESGQQDKVLDVSLTPDAIKGLGKNG